MKSMEDKMEETDQSVQGLVGRVTMLERAPLEEPHSQVADLREPRRQPIGPRAPSANERRFRGPAYEDEILEDEDERNGRFWPTRQRQRDPDEDDRVLRTVRADSPSFEGSLDPCVYLDWEAGMDRYFEWYDMTDQ